MITDHIRDIDDLYHKNGKIEGKLFIFGQMESKKVENVSKETLLNNKLFFHFNFTKVNRLTHDELIKMIDLSFINKKNNELLLRGLEMHLRASDGTVKGGKDVEDVFNLIKKIDFKFHDLNVLHQLRAIRMVCNASENYWLEVYPDEKSCMEDFKKLQKNVLIKGQSRMDVNLTKILKSFDTMLTDFNKKKFVLMELDKKVVNRKQFYSLTRNDITKDMVKKIDVVSWNDIQTIIRLDDLIEHHYDIIEEMIKKVLEKTKILNNHMIEELTDYQKNGQKRFRMLSEQVQQFVVNVIVTNTYPTFLVQHESTDDAITYVMERDSRMN